MAEYVDCLKESDDIASVSDSNFTLFLTMFMPNYLYGPWRNPDDDHNGWCSILIWRACGVGGNEQFQTNRA